MKTRHIASGIAATVGLIASLGITGCGADVGDPSAESAEIGSTAEALSVLTPNANVADQFSGYETFQDGSGNDLTVVLGGYDNAGNGTTLAAVFNPSLVGQNQWQNLSAALPTALGEVEVKLINSTSTTRVFLVAGGRTAIDGAGVTNSYVLTLSGANFLTASWSAVINMGTGRVIGLENLQKCGTSKFIAIGGMTDDGMKVHAARAATAVIEVFDPSTNTWATLKKAGTNTAVQLTTARGYHEVFHVSDTDLRIMGGSTGANFAINTAEKLTVNNSCEATNANGFNKLPALNNLPSARARLTSIPQAVAFGGVNYDFVAAGGDDNSPYTAPTDVLLYRSANDSWTTVCAAGVTGSTTPITGRIFPRSVLNGTGVKFATGVLPDATNSVFFYNTTAVVNTLSSTGVCGTVTGLATDRVGSFVSNLGGSSYAGFGAQHTNTAGQAPTSMPNDIETF